MSYKGIIQKRDVGWLGKCYNQWCKNKAPSNDNDKDETLEIAWDSI
jgi:hypothetical protein